MADSPVIFDRRMLRIRRARAIALGPSTFLADRVAEDMADRLAAVVGGDTLTELRQSFAIAETQIEAGVSPRVAPFADLRDLGGLLQRAGFALPVTDVERLTVRYDTPLALMHDLRRMGATNAL